MKKLQFRNGAMRELRRSAAVRSFTREVAERVARASGPGFIVKEAPGTNRARFIVVPASPEAYRANHESLAVLRGLNSV